MTSDIRRVWWRSLGGARLVTALLAVSCSASSGTQGSGGSGGGAPVDAGGSSGGTSGGSSGGAPGTGGRASGSGGVTGTGGVATGGTVGTGGTTGAGGVVGTGGVVGAGGVRGTAGARGSGGAVGSGGAAGTGGARGTGGGAVGTGGAVMDAGMGVDAPPLGATVTVHVAGDSTAAIFPSTDATMRVGWASVLQPLFDSSVTVDDAARSGRSSKSFIDEGFWATLQAQIAPGDYLFVQFAHNDEKTDDPARYTDPATTYRDNLRTYIAGARARGGVPVLMTSICRREFSGNTVTASHGAYTTAMFAVGQETGTPVVDMEKLTHDWLMALGPTNSIPMFAMGDNTHLVAPGAAAVAKLAIQGIRAAGLPLAARALP